MADPSSHPPPSPPKSTTSSTLSTSTPTPSPPRSETPPYNPPTNTLPSSTTLLSLATTPLYTTPNTTTPIPFSTLFTPNSTTLLVFIRHFFCGNCQEYLRRLATLIPPPSIPEGTRIIIIGFGAPSLIPSYIDALDLIPPFPYPIYAEPSKTLHQNLGMHSTLSLGTKSPGYMQRSLLRVNLESTVQGLKRLWSGEGDALLGGDMRLNGGEFLVRCDAQGRTEVKWCHRMGNSRGHVEVGILKVVLGLDETEKHEIETKPSNETDPTTSSSSSAPPHVPSKPERPGIGRRKSTVDRLRRSISNRRQSWIGDRRNGSVGREKEGRCINNSSRDAGQRRSPEPVGMNVMREEVRRRDGWKKEKLAFETVGSVVST